MESKLLSSEEILVLTQKFFNSLPIEYKEKFYRSNKTLLLAFDETNENLEPRSSNVFFTKEKPRYTEHYWGESL